MKFETQRLLIVPFQNEQIHEFLDFHNQEEVMEFVGNGNFNWSEKQILEKIERFSESELFTIHSVILKETNQVIGEFSVFNSFESNQKVEIGYIINSKYWNFGYATELIKTAIEKIKIDFQVNSIIANINHQNKVSIAICKKLNFVCIDTQTINNTTRQTYLI